MARALLIAPSRVQVSVEAEVALRRLRSSRRRRLHGRDLDAADVDLNVFAVVLHVRRDRAPRAKSCGV